VGPRDSGGGKPAAEPAVRRIVSSGCKDLFLKLAWAPSTSLRAGMERTYRWIYDQAKAREEGRPYIAAAA